MNDAATNSIIEVSKNLTNVSSQMSDYIKLKNRLLENQIKAGEKNKPNLNSSDGFLNIINTEYCSLPVGAQENVLMLILKEIENVLNS